MCAVSVVISTRICLREPTVPLFLSALLRPLPFSPALWLRLNPRFRSGRPGEDISAPGGDSTAQF